MCVHAHHENAERNPWRIKKKTVATNRNNKKTKIIIPLICKKNAADIIARNGMEMIRVANVPSTSVAALIAKSRRERTKLEIIFFLHALSEYFRAENIEWCFTIIPQAAYFIKNEMATYTMSVKTTDKRNTYDDCVARRKCVDSKNKKIRIFAKIFSHNICQNFFFPNESISRNVFLFMAFGFWAIYMIDPCETREAQIIAPATIRVMERKRII